MELGDVEENVETDAVKQRSKEAIMKGIEILLQKQTLMVQSLFLLNSYLFSGLDRS